ncbi:MlaD family protein [Comamonadaceae bacterium M7527]|nr:MlaD family protein [Comamonadaceae bacterium M7527]
MSETTPTNVPSAEVTPLLRLKAFVLLLVLAVLLIGSTTYILYARGVFEQTQRLVLFTDDAEGVSVGMNMTFAGFELGRVTRISLGDDGNARLDIDIPTSNAKWLRASSVFTLERGLVGGSKIKAYTGVLEDDPLPDNAQRTLLRGDATAQIPFIAAAAKDLIDELRGLVAKTAGEQGALGVMMGNEADRANVIKLLAQTQQLMGSVDSVARHADRQVFGRGGLVPQGTQALAQAEQTLAQTTQMLKEVRASLQRVDGVLQDAQAISASAKEASVDLVGLRTEVEGSLRQVNGLMTTLQSTWPLGTAPQPVQLP